MELKQTEELDLAYRFVSETNENIFLTGKAGTGKTTFLKYVRENSVKNVVVAAPTGVAAINARGVTLHSLFQLPFGIILPYNLYDGNPQSLKNHPLLSKIHYGREKLALLKSVELLIIDEVSMVTCYIIDAIDVILRNIKKNYSRPFGGVQVLFIGDLYQLPPVIKKGDWEILRDYYSSIFFFESIVLRENHPIVIELKKIFRQKDNKFIEILNGIRNNNISDNNFYLLNSRLDPDFTPEENEGYITLTTHNYQSDEINRVKLNNLSSEEYIFTAEITGEFPEHSYPAEKELILKSGAQVMFLKNDSEGKKYFNGKIGIITELRSDRIIVSCKDDQSDIEVKKYEWQNISYRVNPETREITEEVLGSFFQYPLRLAWANTIHKSQGLTFEKVIIDAEKAFAMGQVYVALSRCTSLDGLVLRTPVYNNYLGAHKDVKKWQFNSGDIDLAQKFIESRQKYILQELQNIFTWTKWYNALKEFLEFLSDKNELSETAEEEIKIPVGSIQWLIGLLEKQKHLDQIAEKFRQLLYKLYLQNPAIEQNEILQQRLKDASAYFFKELRLWEELFFNHHISADTRKLARKIDKFLGEISLSLSEILYKVNHCKTGFILNEYLAAIRLYNPGPLKPLKSSLSGKYKKMNTVEETIILFRKGKSIPEIASLRKLSTGTIETHLAQAVKRNIIQIEEIMDMDSVLEIAGHFPKDLDDIRLTPIKEKLPPEISYGAMRLVLAWLQKKN